jgi:hypothetical protein
MIATTDALIHEEIKRLHAHGNSDWLTLFRQTEKVRTVKWHFLQQFSQACTPIYSIIYDEWGRGTGKTTHLTKKLKQAAETMPRGLGLFVVPTYSMFSTEIYSSLRTGFEQNGWYEGLHYFVGRSAPENWKWDKPYKSPKKFDRCIHTCTGFTFIIVSQDADNAGVGTSTDMQVSDESGLLSWKYMSQVIFPTVRGSGNRQIQKEFQKNSPYFMKHLFHSSTPVIPIGQELLYGLEGGNYSEDLGKLGIGGVKITRGNYKFNRQNLADNYAEINKILIPDKVLYGAQIENIRPPSVSGGYYTGLDKHIHAYLPPITPFRGLIGVERDVRSDADVLANKPLILGVDWGDVINSLVVAQVVGTEIRALNDMYALGDNNENQDDLALKFTNYYKHHGSRQVDIYYDKTGNNRVGNSRKTRAQQFAEVLKKQGFHVSLKTKGNYNVSHDKRRLLWQNILREGSNGMFEKHDSRFPTFRINSINCKHLWVSMTNSPVKTNRDGTDTKDKSSENRNSNVLPQHATHFGDAVDSIVWSLFARLLRSLGVILPDSGI